jgi:CXXC-20-CXXC protein
MSIQKCKKCGKQFKYATIVKSNFINYSPIKCDNCKSKHSVIFIYRILFGFSIGLPILFTKQLYFLFEIGTIYVYFIWISLIILLSPFYVSYKLKNMTDK